MPYKDYPKYLREIADSISNIESFLGGMTEAQMRADRKTEAAVERELHIITEAAKRLGDEADVYCPGPDWRNIRGFGNYLRHAYDQIDPAYLCSLLKDQLPQLKQQVLPAIARFPQPEDD